MRLKEHEAIAATVHSNGSRFRYEIQPFVIADDMAKYFVEFERVCKISSIERDPCALTSVALLSSESLDEIKHLLMGGLENYDELKGFLLRRYSFSPADLSKRHRHERRSMRSFLDFAYQLKADILEWPNSQEVLDDRE